MWMTLYELGKKNVKRAVWKIAFLSVKDNVEIQLWKGEWENYTTKIIVIEITICVKMYTTIIRFFVCTQFLKNQHHSKPNREDSVGTQKYCKLSMQKVFAQTSLLLQK